MVTARRIGADSTDVRQADHNDAVAVLRKSYYSRKFDVCTLPTPVHLVGLNLLSQSPGRPQD
jgi:hypothetical protein